jgi:sec-independent protein translocase protein TatA
MAGLGAPELLIVLVIILFVFGSSKLPQLARSLGTAKREFEHGQVEHRRAEAPAIEPAIDPASSRAPSEREAG